MCFSISAGGTAYDMGADRHMLCSCQLGEESGELVMSAFLSRIWLTPAGPELPGQIEAGGRLRRGAPMNFDEQGRLVAVWQLVVFVLGCVEVHEGGIAIFC